MGGARQRVCEGGGVGSGWHLWRSGMASSPMSILSVARSGVSQVVRVVGALARVGRADFDRRVVERRPCGECRRFVVSIREFAPPFVEAETFGDDVERAAFDFGVD